MDLAKPHLDVGLYCNDIAASRAFYEGEFGLPYEELLKVGRGLQQHRLGLNGAVLKLNSSLEALPVGLPTCLRELTIATPSVTEPVSRTDPDGVPAMLVPPGHDGVTTVGVTWASRDPDRLATLLSSGFDATPAGHQRWRVGSTLLRLHYDPSAEHDQERSAGFRYLTVQVRDVFAEHGRLVALGWRDEMSPLRLGDVAVISFVADPDGVMVEISQRASLTGPLPS